MTKLEFDRLQVGDRVVAVLYNKLTNLKYSPDYPNRPEIGKIYIVSKVISEDGCQDISVIGLPGDWMRERFNIINRDNTVTEEERQ